MYRDFSIHAPSYLIDAGDALRLENPSIPLFCQPNALLQQRYRLLKPLDQGGFGKTFLARDEHQPEQSFCVIKQLLVSSIYRQSTALFQQEAQCLAEVGEHPQIPQLLNRFEQDGQLFIVQEWVDGSTLEQEALEQPFDEEDVWTLLRALLPVLHFLHDRKIIHRDIKPANIIRRHTGDAYSYSQPLVLVDFGAAKQVDDVQVTSTETFIGSAEYAAPEQIRGRAVFASDLYSLGVTCLHMLTQVSPFDLYDVGEATWKWEAYLTQPMSAPLKHLLCTLIEPAVRRRYQSAADVLAALNTLAMQAEQSTMQADRAIATSAFARTHSRANGNDLSSGELPTAIAIRAGQAVRSRNTPQRQHWYSVPSEADTTDVAYKVALFLGSRMENTSATPHTAKHDLPTIHHPVTPTPERRGWRLVAVGLGTAVASMAMTCLWLCVSTIFLALTVPPQSGATPSKATSSVLPR